MRKFKDVNELVNDIEGRIVPGILYTGLESIKTST